MNKKKCAFCGVEKHYDCFYKRKQNNNTRASRCIECMRKNDLSKTYEKPKGLDGEIWKDIPGYEGLYQSSNFGRIKSLSRTISQKNGIKRTIREIIIKTHISGMYLAMSTVDVFGNKKTTSVHRLVAITFIPNLENKPCVNHINGIKTDNRVENLEWCTYLENEIHSRDVLNKKYAFGEMSSSAKLTEQKVLAIRRLHKINPKYNRKKIALKLGIHHYSLNDIHRRKSWKHI